VTDSCVQDGEIVY